MPSIDERVVAMSFENSKFEGRVSQTMSSLGKLESTLGKLGSNSGLSKIEGSANRVDLSNLSRGIDALGSKFTALQGIAVVALGNIAAKAALVGGQMIKSLTLNPVTAGFSNYETQINAIQTILANTGLKGKAGLGKVTAALNNLNVYANKTVYNFSEMAKNIGTFTAAGVDLKTATGSIKGIANLAALSGSNSQQASTAMYQLSQAISAGQVHLQDWNSVVNAGMGGTVFQRALAQTAVAMGTLDKNAVKLTGPMKNVSINGQSFRQALQTKPGEKSWLTSKVLTGALQQFTGDMTDAQLKAQGFNDAQIKAIQAQAKVAVDSATKIKTLSQMMEALKEEIASAWSAVFKTIFGGINQAKSLFSGLHNTLQNLLTGPILAFNKRLQVWAKLGGRTTAIEAFKNAFSALGKILGSISKAFHDIFPPQSGKQLYQLTVGFRNLTKELKPSPATLNNLRSTFRGFFAILSIGWYIIKKVAGVIGGLFSTVAGGGGGFLKFTGNIGDFLTALQKVVVKGDALGPVFDKVTKVLQFPLKLLKDIANAFFGLFDGADSGGKAQKALSGVNSKLKPMQKALQSVKDAWHAFVDFLKGLGAKIGPAINKAVEPFRHFGQYISDAIKSDNGDKILKVLQTGFLAGIFLAIKKGLGSGVNVTVGKIDGLNKVLGALTGNLTAMQRNVQAHTLLLIGSAVALLAGAVALLSALDPKKMSAALGAVAIGLGQLVAALALLSKATKGGGLLSLPLVAAGMVEIAFAMVILAGAMKIFATMPWEEIGKGLTAVTGLLGVLAVSLKFMTTSKSLPLVAAGLIGIGIALNVMAGAMKIFATMSWEDIAKGLVAIDTVLFAIATTTRTMGPSMAIMGPGLIAVAIAIGLLAGSVLAFGNMDMETLGKGIGAIAAALALIGFAVQAIPRTVALQAAGLVILSVALAGIAGAIRLMGGADIATTAKGLITMSLALDILALGLNNMSRARALPGAAALLAASVALAVLVPVLGVLGNFKLTTIVEGLGAMAAIFLTLSLIGDVASSGLIALGDALIALAIPVVIVAAGMYLLAKAFTLLGENGAKGAAALVAAVALFLAALPNLIVNFMKGMVGVISAVADVAPKVVDSFVKIIGSILDAIIKSAPKFAQAMTALIGAFLSVVHDNAGRIISSGFRVLLQFLSGIAQHIGKITTKGALIVTRFIQAIADNLPRLITAGANALIAFLQGIGQNIGRVARKAAWAAGKFISAFAQGLVKLADTAAVALIRFLNALAKVIDKREWQLILAGERIGKAIGKGILKGIKNAAADALNLFPGEGFGKKILKAEDKASGGNKANAGKSPSHYHGPHKLIAGMDPNPTITPVLDLSSIESGGQRIMDILSPDALSATTTGKNASAIARERRISEATAAMAESAPLSRKEIKFEQNNYSPESLSPTEVFRRTRTQFSMAEKKLNIGQQMVRVSR